jgi:phosphoglycolate phosphatase
MVWKALDELKTTKENAVYIGDSEVDLATAQNSQMDCISVAWGFRDKKMLESIGAKTIVEYPEEIIPTLAKM